MLRFGRARLAVLASLVVACVFPALAFAHGPQWAAYSKFEATTSGQAIAVVFAFDPPALLRQVQSTAPVKIDRTNVNAFGDSFAEYLWPRFTISNDGRPCSH